MMQIETNTQPGRRPSRSVVYILTNPAGPNAVEAFRRDPDTGRLTILGRYETGGSGDRFSAGLTSHSLVGDGRHLYAVNPASDSISAFAVQNDGALRLLGTVPSGGRLPVCLTLHGRFLYVANQGNSPLSSPENQPPGNYTGFLVRENGMLEPIPGSTIALQRGDSPGEILFNHDGSRLAACRLSAGVVDTFHVRPDGILERGAELRGLPGPFGSVFSPTQPAQLFVSLVAGQAGPPAPGVLSLVLTEEAPRQISVVTDPAQQNACWMAITPDGRHVWASSFSPRSLALYSIDGEGRLTPLSTYLPTEGPGSTDIAIDPAGRFVYQLRVFDPLNPTGTIIPQISVLEVTGGGENGGLRLVQSLSLSQDLETAGVMGMLVVDLD